MHENTPVLDHQEQQQAEALDFVAWQQQSEVGQVTAETLPEAQSNQSELAPPVDIFEQLGDTVVTIFGVTAPLNKLPECPYGQHSFEARQRFGVKILEKNNIAIPETFAHLRSEPPKQNAEAAVNDQHKKTTSKLETAEVPTELVTSVQHVEASSKVIEVTSDTKLLVPEVEPTPASQDATESEFSEPPKTIGEAPVTAGGGPDLNELSKETTDGLDTLRLPNVTILKNDLLGLDPSTFKSIKVAGVNSAEHSEIAILPTVQVAQAETLQTSEATIKRSYEEQMVELYLEAASEVTSNGDIESEVVATSAAISDEMIADLLGTDITRSIEDSELISGSFELPVMPEIPYEHSADILSYIPSAETTEVLQAEQPLALRALPVEVAASYQKMIDELEPEAAEHLVEMVEIMSVIIERLQVLESQNQAEDIEGQQIITVLGTYYDQLMQALKVPIDVESRSLFIVQVRSSAFRKTIAQTFNIPLEGTREFNRDLIKQALMSQGRLQPADRKPINLARIFALLGIGHDLQDA